MKRSAIGLVMLPVALLSSIALYAVFYSHPNLDVEWTGCAAERPGPRCELTGPTDLILWTAADPTCGPPAVHVDGQSRTSTVNLVDGGYQIRTTVVPDDEALEVWGCRRNRWTLALAPRPVHPSLEKLRQLANRDPRRALAHSRKTEPFPPAVRGFARWIQARLIAMLDGIEAAEPAFTAAIRALENDQHISEACAARAALSHFMVEAMRFEDAQAALQDNDRCRSASPTAGAYWPYYRAIIAIETYQLREALELLGDATRRQRRLDLQGQLQVTRQQYGRVLALLGRFDAATEILQEAQTGPDVCYQVYATNELAWAALQAQEAEQSFLSSNETVALLRRGLEQAQACGSSDEIEADLLSNLTFALIFAADADGAIQTLARAQNRARADHARTASWWLEAKGHIDRLRGRWPQASQGFKALWRHGARILDETVQLRATLGLGQLARDQQKVSEAIAAYRRAEDHLESILSFAPLGQGRSTFVDARGASTTALIELLLEDGQIDEAAAAARRSLRRTLRTVAQTARLAQLNPTQKTAWRQRIGRYRIERQALSRPEAWRLSQTELDRLTTALKQARAELITGMDAFAPRSPSSETGTELGASTLRLVLHPLTGGRWGLFAQTARITKGLAIGKLEPPLSRRRLSERLLTPIADLIRTVDTIVLVVPSALHHLDLNTLPFDGRPLIAGRTVLYSMDLQRPLDSPRPRLRGLVAFDQSGRLATAEQEARAVADVLSGRLITGSKALADLSEALPDGDHFHFAGHGYASGVDGFDSGLMLDQSTAFTSLDVLSLARVPPTVVLSGCEMA
ncbi:MAG: hypothetical protein AAF449_15020, partial [Myxococcota bacterium]